MDGNPLEDKLSKLHETLVDTIQKRIENPDCKAADLMAALKLLADNGVNMDLLKTSQGAKIAKAVYANLPFKVVGD